MVILLHRCDQIEFSFSYDLGSSAGNGCSSEIFSRVSVSLAVLALSLAETPEDYQSESPDI